MEVNDRQRFLGKRKRSHLGSVSGGYSEIVPSKKTSHFKENCSAEKVYHHTLVKNYTCWFTYIRITCVPTCTS